jgi:hypothetical protein
MWRFLLLVVVCKHDTAQIPLHAAGDLAEMTHRQLRLMETA